MSAYTSRAETSSARDVDRSGSELEEQVDGGGELTLLLGVVAEGGVVGEVAAHLGPQLDVLVGVPVQAGGDHLVVVGEAGARALHVAEPLALDVEVPRLVQVEQAD